MRLSRPLNDVLERNVVRFEDIDQRERPFPRQRLEHAGRKRMSMAEGCPHGRDVGGHRRVYTAVRGTECEDPLLPGFLGDGLVAQCPAEMSAHDSCDLRVTVSTASTWINDRLMAEAVRLQQRRHCKLSGVLPGDPEKGHVGERVLDDPVPQDVGAMKELQILEEERQDVQM